MASPENLDIASLLTPVGDDAPAGVDLRSGEDANAAAALRDLRAETREARVLERMSPPDSEGDLPKQSAPLDRWRQISDAAQRLLCTVSKDLEATAYLIEAQLRLSGFAGLRDASRVAAGLVLDFWEVLYPRAGAEEGPARRLAAIRYLDDPAGSFATRLRVTPVLGAMGNIDLSYWTLVKLEELERVEDETKREEQRLRSRLPTKDAVNAEVMEAGKAKPILLSALDDVAAAIAAVAELNTATQERCGIAILGTISEVLGDIQWRLCQLAPSASVLVPPAGGPPAVGRTGTAEWAPNGHLSTALVPHLPGGDLDREEALRVLGQIAAQFRHKEPHSPLSYLLDQAVRWGRLPLPDLMAELLPEGDVRERYFRMTGLPSKPI